MGKRGDVTKLQVVSKRHLLPHQFGSNGGSRHKSIQRRTPPQQKLIRGGFDRFYGAATWLGDGFLVAVGGWILIGKMTYEDVCD